jgi:hypothetical protein
MILGLLSILLLVGSSSPPPAAAVAGYKTLVEDEEFSIPTVASRPDDKVLHNWYPGVWWQGPPKLSQINVSNGVLDVAEGSYLPDDNSGRILFRRNRAYFPLRLLRSKNEVG